MEKKGIELIVTGSYHYYAVNEVARDFLQFGNKKSYSDRMLDIMRKYFEVIILSEEDEVYD